MEQEARVGRIGDAGVLARLADVVMAVIVRGWVECGCGNQNCPVLFLPCIVIPDTTGLWRNWQLKVVFHDRCLQSASSR